jgi:hypothetical protein
MDSERVTKIMQPRLKTPTVGTPHASMFSQPFEGTVQGTPMNSFSSFVEEEGTGGPNRWMRGRAPACVLAQNFCQVRADGNQSGLEKLGIANGEKGSR